LPLFALHASLLIPCSPSRTVTPVISFGRRGRSPVKADPQREPLFFCSFDFHASVERSLV
jgi:hypothetical protein